MIQKLVDKTLFFERHTSYPLYNLLYLHRDLTISFKELCNYLGLKTDSFTNYFEFKDLVLDPAYSEIHNKTGLCYDYQGFENGKTIQFSHISLRPVH